MVLLDTVLGRVLRGTFQPLGHTELTAVNVLSTHVLQTSCDSPIVNSDNFNKFWEVAAVGDISDNECDFNTSAFMKQIQFNGERYTVPLPWKPNNELLPDHYINCYQRLQSLLVGLRKTPELLEAYEEKIKRQEADKIIERVAQEDLFISAGNVHYLPPRAVYVQTKKPGATNRVRRFF